MLPQSIWREPANERDLKLEQAVQFLNGPDFLPAESQPAHLDFILDAPDGRFRFPTPRPGEFAVNNVVHGRLYRCADAWQDVKAVQKEFQNPPELGDLRTQTRSFHIPDSSCILAKRMQD